MHTTTRLNRFIVLSLVLIMALSMLPVFAAAAEAGEGEEGGCTTLHVWEVTDYVAATCEEDGYQIRFCIKCEAVEETVLPATGHNHQAYVTAPTCETAGYTTYVCACGDSYVDDEVEALGHDLVEYGLEPNCTEAGYLAVGCLRCERVLEETELAPLGHEDETVTYHLTCTEDGGTKHTCTVCGEVWFTDVVKAAGHQYEITEENGYNRYTCTVCGDTYTDEVVVSYDRISVLNNGKTYVIGVFMNGQHYALSHAGNTISLVPIQRENNWISSEVTEDMLWTYSNKKLSYESDGVTYYLYGTGHNKEVTVSTTKGSNVTLTGNRVKLGSYYLRYNNGKAVTSLNGANAYMYVEH